jgi:ribonuclease HI
MTVFCDGAVEPINPGGTGACAFVVLDEAGAVIKSQVGIIPPAPDLSNNVAEYRALRGALRWLKEHSRSNDQIEIRMDSQLVVNQVNGSWQCNKSHLALLRDECRLLLEKLPTAKLSWVPREQNAVADDLAKQALLKAGVRVIDRSKWRK